MVLMIDSYTTTTDANSVQKKIKMFNPCSSEYVPRGNSKFNSFRQIRNAAFLASLVLRFKLFKSDEMAVKAPRKSNSAKKNSSLYLRNTDSNSISLLVGRYFNDSEEEGEGGKGLEELSELCALDLSGESDGTEPLRASDIMATLSIRLPLPERKRKKF